MSRFASRAGYRPVGILCLAIALASFTNVSTVRAAGAPTAPTINVSPGTPQTGGAISPGKVAAISGIGFGGSEAILLTINGATVTTSPTPLVTAADGSFSGTFLAPKLSVRAFPLVVTGQTSGLSASAFLWLKAPSESVYSPPSASSTYQITDPANREPVMQYLRITNAGDANLVNPKVLPDSLPGQDAVVDLSSPQTIVNGIFAAHPEATTDARKAFVLWQWLTDYSYHYYDAQNPNTVAQPDIIALLNNYGFTRCFNHTRILADLFATAGYQTRATNLNDHAVPEVFYGGAWHMYDADEEKFFVGADGTTVLDVPSLVGNTEPVFLNTNPAGVAYHYTAPFMANLYATSGDNSPLANIYPPAQHNMGLVLRKNETLMQNWSTTGEFHDNYLHSPRPPVITNGDLLYTPDLALASYINGVYSQSNVSGFSQDGAQPNLHAAAAGTTSDVTYRVQSPYTLVGSLLQAQTYRASASDSVSIYASLDGANWGMPIYTQTRLGYDNPQLNLSALLNNGTLPEEYSYFVKFVWTASSSTSGAGINGFNLDSRFQQAWEAIPPLHSGTTTIIYSDASGVGHAPGDVQVAYGWQHQNTVTDFGGSSLVTDATSVPANGATFANVVATLKTTAGAKLPGVVANLTPNPAAGIWVQRTYNNQGLRGQTDANGQAAFEVRSTQAGSVTLTATDKNGVSLGLKPLTVIFTQPAAPPTPTMSEGGATVNGGFESGNLSGWTAGGAIAPVVESSFVNSGSYAAQLGATTPTAASPADSWLVETLTVPGTAKRLLLNYWFVNPAADPNNTFQVWVRDTSGNDLYQLLSVKGNNSGWQLASLTYLNKYQGNTIQIFVVTHHDGTSNPAYAYLDNVQFG